MSKFHRTAISRKNFSTPVQYLLNNHLIDERYDILDYGCGRGYDVEHLAEQDFSIQGHDPNGKYSEDWTVLNRKYDIVLCNYVLNVIEDWNERLEVENNIINLLENDGVAYIAIRNDRCVANGCTSTGTWQGYVKPIHENWVLVEENSKFKLWKYWNKRV